VEYDAEIIFRKPDGRPSAIVGFSEFCQFVEKTARLPVIARVLVDMSSVHFAHPSGMAPLIAYTRHLTERGWVVDLALPDDSFLASYFKKAGWIDGLEGTHLPLRVGGPRETYIPLVSYSTHDELNPIINEALRHFARQSSFQKGVLDGLEWALNEVADNVLIHSGGARGWLQLSQQPSKGLIEVVVADCGQGILNSLREGHPEIHSDVAALELAVEKGVTRNPNIGQGNGLAGTLRIALAAHGFVNLYSGAGLLRYLQPASEDSDAGRLFTQPASYLQGTVVTLTLPTLRKIDIANALWGHATTTMFENEYISESGTEIIFRVANEASGFGNRPSAMPLRVAIENLLRQFPTQKLIVDFSGVSLVSASFADEFIARLAKNLGVVTFFQRISIVGMNDLIRRTMDAVIEQRLKA
jgi:hypothetical protein